MSERKDKIIYKLWTIRLTENLKATEESNKIVG